MDSLTHIAVGACMGEAFSGRILGKRAMLWGAMAQSLPDIDFLAGLWMDTASNLLAHRGFTHSILFCVVVSPFLALAADRLHQPHNITFKNWLLFFFGTISGHIFLDAFNNYGVGWFEPFSNERISFNAIYVADPFFSIWSAIALVPLIYLKRNSLKRKFWWKFGLFIPAIYLSYCLLNKTKMDMDTRDILRRQHVDYTRYFTTPAPLQNWLWYVVAGNDSGYHVGFRSLFDTKKEMSLEYFPRNNHLLDTIMDHEDVHKLIRFSQEFYTVEQWSDTLVFNDLRFGQIVGWHNPKEKFVFHYFLQHPNDNTLVVQRGRFARWDLDVARSMFRRIWGN
mgnify:CR=1 FL=1